MALREVSSRGPGQELRQVHPGLLLQVHLLQVHLGPGLLLDPVLALLETPAMAVMAVTR